VNDLDLLIRTSSFALVFAAMALWEVASPRGGSAPGRSGRCRALRSEIRAH
jgi:hypothetical protein